MGDIMHEYYMKVHSLFLSDPFYEFLFHISTIILFVSFVLLIHFHFKNKRK